MERVTYQTDWLHSGSRRMANPGERNEKNNAQEPEDQNQPTPWYVTFQPALKRPTQMLAAIRPRRNCQT